MRERERGRQADRLRTRDGKRNNEKEESSTARKKKRSTIVRINKDQVQQM